MNRITKIIAIIMSVFMVFSLAACGDAEDEWETYSEVVWVDDDSSDTQEQDNIDSEEDKDSSKDDDKDSSKDDDKDSSKDDNKDSSKDDGKDSGKDDGKDSSKDDDKNSSKDDGKDSGKDDNKDSNKDDGKDSNKDNNNNSKVNAEDYRGSTVKILYHHELVDDEKKLMENFTKETGIKIDVTTATSDYLSKAAAMIAANEGLDIAIIPMGASNSQGAFPVGVKKLFQPATVTKQDMTDSFWSKPVLDAYSIGGKPYVFVSSKPNWFNVSSILVYNKELFEDNGITTPRELWKKGNWNWDTMAEIAGEITDLSTSKTKYVGLSFPDTLSSIVFSAGTDFFTYNGSKFESNIQSTEFLNAWKFHSKIMYEDEVAGLWEDVSASWGEGLVGMMQTNLWYLRADSHSVPFEVDAVPFPNPKGKENIVLNSNLFAICKNSKNPVAAGIFLRYYLDPANYPRTFEQISYCKSAKDTFEYLGKLDGSVKVVCPYTGVIGYSDYKTHGQFGYTLIKTESSQLKSVIDANASVYKKAAEQANKAIK